MKTVLLVVGKTNGAELNALIDDYVRRVGHYAPFQVDTVPELRSAKNLSQEQQCAEEGKMILKAFRPGDVVVLLDERGEELRSVEFAARLERLFHRSARLVFVIGGPYGFSSEVYARADLKLSLSRMTFSHQMVRLLFVEQLYRAFTILRGEPYHHE